MVRQVFAREERGAPLRLTEFIEEHHDRIVGEWVAFARTLTPWSDGLSEEDLRDHAEELLDAIVVDMRSSQTTREQAEKGKGRDVGGPLSTVGKKHAIDRLEGGLMLDQLMSEYRALRASVLRQWEAAEGGTTDEMTRFNEAIDETLAESAAWYTEQLARTREQFLAILGHDLRTPLASIAMGATLLSRAENLEVKQVGVVTRMRNSAERMSRMVSDLLDLTRTRLGAGIPITPTPVELTSVCQQTLAELEAAYPDCQLHFESSGDLQGEWDADRLVQVVSNLVSNALQYGREDAPVSVVARAQGDEVVLSVHNSGDPIDERALKRIFEPMVRQGTQGDTRNGSGLGLGLFIARKIVASHGGTIGVTSTAEGGTTFTVKLPRHAPQGPSLAAMTSLPRQASPDDLEATSG